MKKRFLAVFLALALCVGLCAVPAFAADSDFVIENGVLTKYNGPGGDVVIPDGVTKIGESAFYCMTSRFDGHTSLTSVIIPDSVTCIADQAFFKCDLTSVTIPNEVTEIGKYAFYECLNLENVIVPDSVTEIGDFAFMGTPWDESLGEFGIVNGNLFSYHGTGGAVTIPDNVSQICGGAFWRCESLTSVTIPGSVKKIGQYAFSGCSENLASVIIKNGVIEIGSEAFSDCYCLKSVTIPRSVTDIGVDAFACFIYGSGGGPEDSFIPHNLTMYSEAGSYAETYAKENGIPFVTLIHGFTDLSSTGFYLDAVEWAVANGVTTGKTATTFAPDLKCSHSEILTFLWRAAGKPASSAQAPIALNGDEYYAGAVRWAAEKGMIGAGFDLNAPCSRADAVLYIWQAFNKGAASYNGQFTDVSANSPYATAVAWALAKGVTTGTSATTFSPDDICSRGQIVTFLHRAYK